MNSLEYELNCQQNILFLIIIKTFIVNGPKTFYNQLESFILQ